MVLIFVWVTMMKISLFDLLKIGCFQVRFSVKLSSETEIEIEMPEFNTY